MNQGRLHALACAAALLAAALALAISPAGAAGDEAAGADPEVVAGELVVGFEPQASASAERHAVTKAGGRIEDRVESIDSAVVVSRRNRTTDEVAAELSESEVVEFVEPNYVLRATRLPTDPLFNHSWGLRNTGQLSGKPGADINAAGAWDVTIGTDVIVAVVDTGVDYSHPDLDNNLWTNPRDPANGADDDQNGFVDDLHGADFAGGDSDPMDDSSHGTHVAGIIGAEGGNGTGSTGVNWKVRLMALKFLDRNGEGSTSAAAKAIDYAVDGGARVINASWGGPGYSYALFKAIRQAATRNVLFVAAAGNEGQNSDVAAEYPAAFDLPNVVSVAATDPTDTLADFSNYGARTADLAAPGDEIYSTVPRSASTSGYASYSGTSMAAPFVSGAAALYLARTPAVTYGQTRDALMQSVDGLPSLAGRTVSGGRLNIGKALGVARPSEQAAAPPSRDSTAPSPFRLISPRNRYRSRKRRLRFRWQASHDPSGIRVYRLFVDGKHRKTIRDRDGRGGRAPSTRVFYRLRGGKHRWHVRAYDYAGNSRKSQRSKRNTKAARMFVIRRVKR